MVKSKSTSVSFEEIVQYCRLHIKGLEPPKKGFAQILKILPAPLEKSSHFEILGDDYNETLYVEFHIEKDRDTKILQTLIKHWERIHVFDKKIQYDPKWYEKGRLRIGCSYSDGIEKICAYIYEFIYQVKSRIDLAGGSK
jgi:hypothetical protein